MADATKELQILITAQDEATQVIQGIGSGFASMAQRAAAGSAVIAGALVLVGKGALDAAENFQQTRITFDALIGDTQLAGTTLLQLQDIADKTNFDIPSIDDAGKKLLSMGVTVQNLVPDMKNLADIASVVGSPIDSVAQSFGKVSDAGKLTSITLRSFATENVPVIEILAQSMGKTSDQIVQMVSNGKISFKDLSDAMAATTPIMNQIYSGAQQLGDSVPGILSQIGNQAKIMGADFLGVQNGTVNSGGLFDKLTTALNQVLTFLNEVTPKISEFMSVFLNNTPAIAGAIGGLIGLLIPLAIALVTLLAPALLFIAAGIAIGLAIGLIIEKLPGIIAFFKQLGDKIKDFVTQGVSDVRQFIDNIVEWFQELPPKIDAYLQQALASVQAFVAGVVTWFQQLPEKITQALQQLAVSILYWIGYIAGWLITNVPLMITTFINWWHNLPSQIALILIELALAVSNEVTAIQDWLAVTIPALITALITWFQQIPVTIDGIFVTTKTNVTNRVTDTATWLKTEISQWPARIKSFLETIPDIVNAIFQAAKDDVENMMSSMFDTVTNWWNKIKDVLDSIKSAAQDAANAVSAGVQAGKAKIGFQHGGIVPGSYDQAVPAILHGGERVIPKNGLDANPNGGSSGGGSGITINISGSFSLDSDDRIQQLADKISSVLGRQNELAAKGYGI